MTPLTTQLTTLGVIRELIRYRPGRFFFSFLMWTVTHGSPLLFGILIGAVFDRLAGDADLAATAWTPVAIFSASGDWTQRDHLARRCCLGQTLE